MDQNEFECVCGHRSPIHKMNGKTRGVCEECLKVHIWEGSGIPTVEELRQYWLEVWGVDPDKKHSTNIKGPSTVAHPDYYGGKENPYEAIKVIESWGLGFCLGNVVKYISRAGKKDPKREIEDLKKAAWYLDRHIKSLEGVSNS